MDMKKLNVLFLIACFAIFITGIILKGFFGGFLAGFSAVFIIFVILGDFLAKKLDQKINKVLFHLINKK